VVTGTFFESKDTGVVKVNAGKLETAAEGAEDGAAMAMPGRLAVPARRGFCNDSNAK
jgi:hypothetical protein